MPKKSDKLSNAIIPPDSSQKSEVPALQGPRLHLQFQQQGLIPPPETLEKIEKILPGATERIFKMAEKEQSHKMNMQGKSSSRTFWQEWWAKCFPFALVIIVETIAGYCAIKGQPIFGGVIGSAGLVVITLGFLQRNGK